jgi:VWFA-related protein
MRKRAGTTRLVLLFSIAAAAVCGVVAVLGAQTPTKQSVQSAPPAQPQEGQLQASQPSDDDLTFKTSVKEVMAPVTVTDQKGNVVNGLTALDFQLLDNGKPQTITTVDTYAHPISLVVAVQANSAVEQILPQIQKIGSVFDQVVVGETGEIAVLAFDHRIQTMTPFTSDPDKIHNAFKRIKPGSNPSHLNEATTAALNMLRNRPPERRRIVVLISESHDNGSHFRVRDVLTEAEFANIVIYTVDISHLLTSLTAKQLPNRQANIPPGGIALPNGQVMTPTLELEQNQNGNYVPIFKEMFTAVKDIFIPDPLKVYTQFTGGRQYAFMTQRGLESAVAEIGNELHSQYLLTYSPNNQDEAGLHEIVVQVDKPDLKVRTRTGYWLAAKPK